MAKATELEYLDSAYASYYYIYHYTKGYDAEQLENDAKTLFAVTYLLKHFFWSISQLLTDSFREKNPEMNGLIWIQIAASGAASDTFSIEDVPSIIYEDAKLIEFYKIFEQIYYRNKKRLTSDSKSYSDLSKNNQNKNILGKQKDLDLPIDTHYKDLIHSHSSIWTVKKR